MKALIIAGGYGSRLRPLTLSKPKPIVEFVDKPVIVHQMEALSKVGVTDLILALNYESEKVRDALTPWAEKFGLKLTILLEVRPMGTAGCLSMLEGQLEPNENFFMFNADVIMFDYPLQEIWDFHHKHQAEATILTTCVDDVSKYGVITHDDTGKVLQFIEKPKESISKEINAGIYCLNSNILKRIKPVKTSIEKEVFPAICQDGALYCINSSVDWIDVGNPNDYLNGIRLYMKNKGMTHHVGSNVTIGDNCQIGPNVVISDGCKIGNFVMLENCVILPECVIGSGSCITDSIVGWRSKIGQWCRLFEMCILGQDVTVSDGIVMRSVTILPHKEVGSHTTTPKVRL